MQGASIATVGTLLAGSLRVVAEQPTTENGNNGTSLERLDTGWQFRRGELHDPGDAWESKADAEWEAVELPHCFNALNACDPDVSYFRGKGWYRTRLLLRNPFAEGRTLLHFQGAGQTIRLWAGSELIGTHKGGYDEFAFDISEALEKLGPAERAEPIPITVCCDNLPDAERVPSELSDFCLYGGLYRHVNRVYLPALSLERVHIFPQMKSDGGAEIQVTARLYNPRHLSSQCEVELEVADPKGHRVYQGNFARAAWDAQQRIASFEIRNPELWNPDSPQLYRCRVALTAPEGKSTLEERFGIRRAEFVEGGPFRLNGKRLLLRGTHRHQDHAGVAAGMTDEQVRQEMRMIREMGANFIRLAHYQQDRLVLELCDELGLLVWEEVPWCRAGVGSEAFKQNARDMLTHMIDQHYNHPSVIAWGLGNEDDWPGEYPSVDQQAIRGFMAELRELAHTLDESRATACRRCDFARDIPDVYSPSIWAGWYRGNYREYEQSLLQERERVKRFIHMEWGADSHAGRHTEEPNRVPGSIQTGSGADERGLAHGTTGGDPQVSRDGDWSETYACHLIDWYLKTQEKLDWLTGAAQWIFKDFASPLRGDNGVPRVNQKGVVERDLRKKESYYVFQSYWASRPMAHIYGHSWPVRWGAEGEPRTVLVYSNCETAELFLNGRSEGKRTRASEDFPAAGLRWSVVFAKGQNHLRVVAAKGEEAVSDEISLMYQTESWGRPEQVRLREIARDGARVTVEAKVFDGNGVLCLDAADYVRFSLAGAGRLLDNLGTTRGSREVQFANGRAEISLIRTGKGTVTATVKGLPAASLNC